jgi:hypothetical protein
MRLGLGRFKCDSGWVVSNGRANETRIRFTDAKELGELNQAGVGRIACCWPVFAGTGRREYMKIEGKLMTNRLGNAEYLEFELDAETLADVEALASESNMTPFDMGLILLREAIAFSYDAQSPPEVVSEQTRTCSSPCPPS